MRAFIRYSALKNAAGTAVSPARAASYSRRMSPPAHSARPPAPSTITSETAGSPAHRTRAASIASHIACVSAFSACGRFSVMRPACPLDA